MSDLRSTTSWAFPILDVGVAVLALVGLLPITGALAGIASPAFPLADVAWFTANLAGGLLLLAVGPRMLLPAVRSGWYVGGYTALLAVVGVLRLWLTGFHSLATAWLLMALCVGGLLLIFRRFWLWALIGGLWSGILLGIWSYGGVVSYMSAASPQFPILLPLQIVGSAAAIVVGLLHLRFRRSPPVNIPTTFGSQT